MVGTLGNRGPAQRGFAYGALAGEVSQLSEASPLSSEVSPFRKLEVDFGTDV